MKKTYIKNNNNSLCTVINTDKRNIILLLYYNNNNNNISIIILLWWQVRDDATVIVEQIIFHGALLYALPILEQKIFAVSNQRSVSASSSENNLILYPAPLLVPRMSTSFKAVVSRSLSWILFAQISHFDKSTVTCGVFAVSFL